MLTIFIATQANYWYFMMQHNKE